MRPKKERPHLRSVFRGSAEGHKPKVCVVVVTDEGVRRKTFGLITISDMDEVARLFLNKFVHEKKMKLRRLEREGKFCE